MSFIVKGVKKVVKAVTKFVKKYWKPILLAAAVVFTAGIATVGTAGFASAMASAGGGIGGFLTAAGQTMVAGIASIGGTLGIGNGASLAAFGGTGSATLLNGAAAQAIGFAAPGAAQTAGFAASQTAAQGAAAAASVPGAASTFGVPVASSAPGATAGIMSSGGVPYATGAGLEAAASPLAAGAAAPAAAAAAAPAASKGFLGLLTSQAGTSLLSAGIMGINSYMQAKAANAAAEAEEPKAYWGVALDDGKSMTPDDIRAANSGAGYDPHSYDPPAGTQGTATNGPIFGGH